MRRENPLVGALEVAAARGARVTVVLDGAPIGAHGATQRDIARTNAATVAELRAHGVDARLTGDGAPVVHVKAAVVDGCAYLDDRNWASGDRLLASSDPTDVACVAAAIDGVAGETPDLTTHKAQAIAWEARTIQDGTGDRVDMSSESFGSTPVSKALAARAKGGAHVRLVVSAEALRRASDAERFALGRMADAGVDIRAGRGSDKVCVAGTTAWLGSANATFSPPPPVLDWGIASSDPRVVALAAATFAENWTGGRTIDPAQLTPLSG